MFYQIKVRNEKEYYCINNKIITMVVLVTVIVDRITTMTNNGGFHFFECLEYTDTVLNILYTLSHCNNPMRKMLFSFYGLEKLRFKEVR